MCFFSLWQSLQKRLEAIAPNLGPPRTRGCWSGSVRDQGLPGTPNPGRQVCLVRRGGAVPGATPAGSVADVAWFIQNLSSTIRCDEGAAATVVPSAPGRRRRRGLVDFLHSCAVDSICALEVLLWKKTLASMASCGTWILGDSHILIWRGHWFRNRGI